MANLYVTTPPALEPVTLTEAKAHLRVTHSSEDTLITALVVAARQHVENYLNRAIVTQTLTYKFRQFPECRIVLPRPPLQYVVSVTYYDADNASQTVSSSDYIVHNPTETYGHIELAAASTWPSVYSRDDAVSVRYVAGYPDTGSPTAGVGGVPQAIKQAILLVVGDLFENREAQAEKALAENRTVIALLAPYRDYIQ